MSPRAVAALVTLAYLLMSPAVAGAAFNAQFTGQSGYVTVEQGDRFVAFFELRNTGDQWWYPAGASPNPVLLGTDQPHDRNSVFATTGDWLSPGRPTSADNGITKPGETARFTFVATAPLSNGVFREPFQLVAEGIVWFGTAMFLDWTVVSPQAPTATINGAPTRLYQGTKATAEGTVSDNLAVKSAQWFIDDKALGAPAAPSAGKATTTVDAGALAPGAHTLRLTATDNGGRSATTTTAFEVLAQPTTPAPLAGPALPGPTSPAVVVKPLRWPSSLGFATQQARGTSRSIGRLLAARVRLPRSARMVIRCQRACTGRPGTILTTKGNGAETNRLLSRPLVLTRTTRIRVSISRPGALGRYRIYRFAKSKLGPRSVITGNGCLKPGSHTQTTNC